MPRPTKICVSFVMPEEELLAHEQLGGAALAGKAVHQQPVPRRRTGGHRRNLIRARCREPAFLARRP